MKLADKIVNLRDVAAHPPASWSLERRREYFDWAKEVIDRLRGAHPELEHRFDEAYALKPWGARLVPRGPDPSAIAHHPG